MKYKKRKKIVPVAMILCLTAGIFLGCKKKEEVSEKGEDVVWLTWYQVGDKQKDDQMVLDEVNRYVYEKIGVKIQIKKIKWSDYSQKMQVVIHTDDSWDLCFTSSWTNDYLQNAQNGAYLELDEYLEEDGREMYEQIDARFWEAARVGGKVYGVPSEKEIGSCPMWVFTKEYVDKYDIPYEEIHTLEELEPWLKLIQEKEPDVVPMYLTKDYSAPTYMDKIIDPIGIEYDDESMTVRNLFETEKMNVTLATMRRYYEAGYINKNAPLASDEKSVKRFVTKGDGHPFAEFAWSKDLGYEVVASKITETQITNESARGALTAVNKNTKHPREAVKFLNLVNSDEYLRNLLNYGIEGVHWHKIPVDEEEAGEAEGKPYVYDVKVRLDEKKSKDYSVPYWVQGGLFHTYVLEDEPIDKWMVLKEFNDASKEAPSLGFDFYIEPVKKQVADFRSVLNEFGKALYTGSVDPEVYVPKLLEKLEDIGANQVIEEMQKQVDEWKETRK